MWEATLTVTDAQIDDIHRLFPEGDRDALEQSIRESQARTVYLLELREDGTMSLGLADSPTSEMEGTWKLSEDKRELTFTYQGGIGSSQTTTPFPAASPAALTT